MFSSLIKRCFCQGKLVRGNYGLLSDKTLAEFESILGRTNVLTEDLDGYNTDWLGAIKGQGKVVLRPKTTEEVSAVMKVCYKNNLAVVPQGGNTGLVSGSVPIFDEVILSMSRMNKILDIDELSSTVTCEAGCVLHTVQEAVAQKGLAIPYDLGSKGTCQIGGNVSTCAGGLRIIRYGTMQANILGLTAVTADGTILNLSSNMKKDNTGYHLRQVFVGAEGTLGIVTSATINCPQTPQAVNLAFTGVDSFEDLVKAVQLAKRRLSETLSAMEVIDRLSMEIATEVLNLRSPLKNNHAFSFMVETHGSVAEHDREKMANFLQEAMAQGIIKDAVTTDVPSKLRELWIIRESQAIADNVDCYLYTYDVTLPLNSIYSIVTDAKKQLAGCDVLSVSGYGHLGDGNIHLNVRSREYDQRILDKLEPWVYEWTKRNNGSISSEHGIGSRKTQYMNLIKSKEVIETMRAVKKTLDPKGILNPYKVLPP